MTWTIGTSKTGKRYTFIPQSIDTHTRTYPIGSFAEVIKEYFDGRGRPMMDLQFIDGSILYGVTKDE